MVAVSDISFSSKYFSYTNATTSITEIKINILIRLIIKLSTFGQIFIVKINKIKPGKKELNDKKNLSKSFIGEPQINISCNSFFFKVSS